MSEDEVDAVTFVEGDITDSHAIDRVLDTHGITNVVHLAALQVPFCRADPILGAQVNVVGTVALFEAVRRRTDTVRQIAYASSIAKYDVGDIDPQSLRVEAGAAAHPTTHYGVWKEANEGTARVTWLEGGVSSIGLRPPSIYGVGRDQGMTSTPTKAIVAAVLGQPYQISFGGRCLFLYTEDAARAFVIAGRSALPGANVFNLGGSLVHMDDVVAAIERAVPEATGSITHAGPSLPFPDEFSLDGLELLGPLPSTPLEDGVRQTADLLRDLQRRGRLRPEAHGLAEAT
jgi:nucleoside-diphosphate-sugar epimerase